MSKPIRIALVVEGKTDRIVLEAAISRILDERPFVLTQLQPEESLAFDETAPGGWGRVFRWCQLSAERGRGSLRGDPLFDFHDVLILHLDADVAGKTYASARIHGQPGDLPFSEPCPPARKTTDRLRSVLLRWVGETEVPERTVMCIPSKNTEAWVLAALFPNDLVVTGGQLECFQNPEARLGQQSKKARVRKDFREYKKHSKTLRESWTRVTALCQEAQRFSDEFQRQLPP